MSQEIETVDAEVMMTSDKHHAFGNDLAAVIIKHGKDLRPVELIAITSHALGGLVALLPDSLVQEGYALDLIQRNMDKGNSDTNEMLKPLKLLVSTEDVVN